MRAGLPFAAGLVCLGALFADEVVLKNGSSFEGRIVGETSDSVAIDIGSGVLKFAKDSVARITRTAKADEGPPAPSLPGTIPQALEGDLVASVGPGGVTRKELADRIYGFTRGDSSLVDISPKEARVYLDPLVDDELLFQGAIADGAFDDPTIRKRLCEAQISVQGADTRLTGGTEADLKAWYEAHLADLIEAKRLQVCGAKLYDAADLATERGLEETMGRIERLKAAGPDDPVWDFKGWIGVDEEFLGPKTYDMIKNLRVGECSNDIACSDKSVWAFRVLAREDLPAPPPFERCRDRVRMLIAEERMKALEAADTDETFRAALDGGLHRNSYHRAFIIETYVTRRKTSRAELLTEMRGRFLVDVLLEE
ncbi:MAG: hypothetical protein AAB434_10955 [Planctomycetota bacterium]